MWGLAETCAGETFLMQRQYQEIAVVLDSRVNASGLECYSRLMNVEQVGWSHNHSNSSVATRTNRCHPRQAAHAASMEVCDIDERGESS